MVVGLFSHVRLTQTWETSCRSRLFQRMSNRHFLGNSIGSSRTGCWFFISKDYVCLWVEHQSISSSLFAIIGIVPVFLVHNTFTPSIAILVCMIKVKTICIVPHTDMLLQESKSTENQAARLFDSWTCSFLQTIHHKTLILYHCHWIAFHQVRNSIGIEADTDEHETHSGLYTEHLQ